MSDYNYRESITEDIKNCITDRADEIKAYYHENYDDDNDLKEFLEEELWTEDSVTGNGSGSYTFNTNEAKELVLDSDDGLDTLDEAVNEGYIDYETVGKSILDNAWESLDVTIRCYLLNSCLDDAIGELKDDGFFDIEY